MPKTIEQHNYIVPSSLVLLVEVELSIVAEATAKKDSSQSSSSLYPEEGGGKQMEKHLEPGSVRLGGNQSIDLEIWRTLTLSSSSWL